MVMYPNSIPFPLNGSLIWMFHSEIPLIGARDHWEHGLLRSDGGLDGELCSLRGDFHLRAPWFASNGTMTSQQSSVSPKAKGNTQVLNHYCMSLPMGCMYGIYANIWGILMVNVTIYSIHGSYGLSCENSVGLFVCVSVCDGWCMA